MHLFMLPFTVHVCCMLKPLLASCMYALVDPPLTCVAVSQTIAFLYISPTSPLLISSFLFASSLH